MTTRELIELLQQTDPSGELDVVVNNETIVTALRNPAYYDGCYHKVEYSPSRLSIVGTGTKVQLATIDIPWALMDRPDDEVYFVGMSALQEMMWRDRVAQWREEAREA